MRKYLREIIKDQSGFVSATEMLIVIVGVVVVSGIVLKSLTNPLKTMHEGTTNNMTKVSRGF